MISNILATSDVCDKDRAMLSDIHQAIEYLICNWGYLMSNCIRQHRYFGMIVNQDR